MTCQTCYCGTGGGAPVPVAILVFGGGGKNNGMYVCLKLVLFRSFRNLPRTTPTARTIIVSDVLIVKPFLTHSTFQKTGSLA